MFPSVQHSQQTSFLQNHSDHGSPERVPKRPRMCLTAGSCAVAIETAASVQDGEQRTSRNLLLPRSSQLSCTRRLKQQNAAGLNQKSEGELDGKPNDPQKGESGFFTRFFQALIESITVVVCGLKLRSCMLKELF